MKKVSQEEKDRRFLYMKEMSWHIINFAVAETLRDFGAELAEEVKSCLSLNDNRLHHVVSYYYDKLLYDYKEKNGYFDEKEERNSGRDKMAGLTAIALMTLTPIDVKPHSEKVTAVAEIAETYALFFASTVLHVSFDQPRIPAYKQIVAEQTAQRRIFDALVLGRRQLLTETIRQRNFPVIVTRNMILNLRDLGTIARRRASDKNPITSLEPLADWIIQAMQLYALAFGKIDLRL